MNPVFLPGAFTGETTSWCVADALLSDVRHHKRKVVPAHTHEACYFSILLEGEYSEAAPDFAITYRPYTLVYHAAGTEHSDTIGDVGSRMFFVELLQPWMDVIEELGANPRHFFELDGGEPLWLVLRLYREFAFRESDASATVESLLFELCSYAARASSHEDEPAEPQWLGAVETRLRAGFRSPQKIADIARTVDIHPAHLCKSFRRVRGMTLGDFIVGLRVQFVCRRLVESSEPLNEVALEAGFTDQSHMTRMFKRLTGYSPGVYRREMKVQT